MNSLRHAGFLLVTLLILASSHIDGKAEPSSSAATRRESEIGDRVNALLSRMTTAEKIGQMNLRFLNLGESISDEDVRLGRIGAFLYASDLGYTNYLQRLAVAESRLGIPLLFGLDVISGYRTIFPAPIALASSWDPELVQSTRVIAAREARAAGINWAYAPMVDIARDPRWGRIVEGAGEDPYLGSAMAAAQVRGLQGSDLSEDGRVLACAKHFAAYGAASGGRDYESVSVPENVLRNVYFPPFRAALNAGAKCIMSAYVDINDVPATGNKWLAQDILRGEWGFRGLVVSDAFSVRTLVTHGFAPDLRDAALRAFHAGINIDMEGNAYSAHLQNLVDQQEVSQKQLDDMVRPILDAKMRLGLFRQPYTDETAVARILATPEHRTVARLAAQRSIVLLKNDKHFLPLNKTSQKKIAVIGPMADAQQDLLGPWTTTADFRETITVLAGIREKAGSKVIVTHAQGAQLHRKIPSEFDVHYRIPQQKPWSEQQELLELDHAVVLAKESDLVVLALGESYNMAGENASRASLRLPGRQQHLLERIVALGKPVVLVLIGGRPLDITWASDHVRAILTAWYPGTAGGGAIADLLFGDANPGAKLPMSWPRSVGQLPVYYAQNTTMSPEYAERRYWDEESTPLFPFGFGLSYAAMSITNLRLNTREVRAESPLTVTVDLHNESDISGDEVVQLYTHQRSGSAVRPVRELKGFQRVSLKPRERKSIRLVLNPKDLGYWSSAKRAWVLEHGEFDLWVGNSVAADIHETFRVIP